MNILFITIPFREYVSEIKKTISNELNANVDLFFCDLQPPLIFRIVERFFKFKITKYYNNKKQIEQFSKYKNNEYDCIFVLVGRNINLKVFSEFCKKNDRAKKVLYLWDDIARVNSYDTIKSYFDEIYSFDPIDCKKYNLSFLPLFYCPQFKYNNEKKNLNCSFIGVLHSSRERFLLKIRDICEQYKLRCYFYLQTSRFNFFKQSLKNKTFNIPSYIKFKELSMNDCSSIMKKSICVIDMPHSSQTGLTVRTIESLASKTKLITTNRSILNYDFYNDNNIMVVDENFSNIDVDFFKRPYVDIDASIEEKYSINFWVNKLFFKE